MRWIAFPVLFLTLIQSCGVKESALSAISNARVEISLAEREGAGELATKELDEAKMLIFQAETALSDGHVETARKLADRAFLKARYARLMASYKKTRNELERARAEIEALKSELEAIRKAREEAEEELKRIEEGGR